MKKPFIGIKKLQNKETMKQKMYLRNIMQKKEQKYSQRRLISKIKEN